MDPRTLTVYETQAASLAARYREAKPWTDQEFLEAFGPPPARVGEVGVGSGRDLAHLQRLGYEVRGVEPSAALRAECVREFPALEGRLAPGVLPWGPSPFPEPLDGLLCSAVLMHLPAPEIPESLASLHRALRPGGRLLLMVSPTRPGLDQERRDELGRLYTEIPVEDLLTLAGQAGLSLLRRWERLDGFGRPLAWTRMIFTAA